ncbi:RluA family pseudouridine synthase [Haliea sp. AH-315-K21]|uniref:Pseudouridine synthase n=1 Tax=SAR86 cluster bacterium TaxID=2030880 RepID=A0A2A5CDZ9_9GAMM|nr:RluA family pseudouridine synthase [Haliea sp. AH-315-K21]PCJ42114.1 MAG: 23S rRNA pseudouridine(955/2504/2580) synthase [SAR86 cluster bacterium]
MNVLAELLSEISRELCYNPRSLYKQVSVRMTDGTKPSKVRKLEVDENSVGQRIDNFLLSRLKGVPKTRIYRIIRKGEVRVNSKRIKPDYKLLLADIVRVPPIRVANLEIRIPTPELKQLVQESILYQDEVLLIVNKPSGLSVHAGTGVKISLIDVLRDIYKDEYVELVHRIDKGTSGCLLIARNAKALKQLQAEFKARTVKKDYHALVHGLWPQQLEEINLSLQRSPEAGGERKVYVAEQGQKALTRFSLIKRFTRHSLVLAQPKTGRTHQIRVHAQFAGHSLCADEKYSSIEQRKQLSKLGIKRLCLHAHSLEFTHPESGQLVKVSAPYDERFEFALNMLSSI